MGRTERRAIAEETDAIVAAGGYEVDGEHVDISAALGPALWGSHLHLPDERLPPVADGGRTTVEVTNETTLAATRRVFEAGDPADPDAVVALNFASATKPGGGYRNGAEAQEESLARASALGACLERVPAFYEHHRRQKHPLYTDRVICSPGVPVFRDDAGTLLPRPYPVTFLTAAAPNAGELARRDWTGDLDRALRQRARRVLTVAAAHGHRELVLGAWGCGVFRNDPDHVATVFADLLDTDFASVFARVTFAVVDRSPGAGTFRAFQEALGDLAGRSMTEPSSEPLPPVALAVSFVDCINRRDLPRLTALMSPDHRLEVLDEAPLVGRDANSQAWRGYFDSFPRYVIYPHRIAERDGTVAILGHTTGSHLGLPDDAESRLTLIWLAATADGAVTRWVLLEDSTPNRHAWALDTV